jgi:hypothetical protein
MTEARGWPFLIGAGRRHEYRTLIAPAFLVDAAEHGVLDRHAGEVPDGEVRVVRVRPELWMAYTAYTVTAADVPDPRDEHGRPLRILAGFVCAAPIERPDPGDLAVALDNAIAVYRRYLQDEDRFWVLASEAFPLRSGLRSAPRTPAGGTSRRTLTLLVLAAVVLAAVVVAALLLTLPGGEPDPACSAPPGLTRTTGSPYECA